MKKHLIAAAVAGALAVPAMAQVTVSGTLDVNAYSTTQTKTGANVGQGELSTSVKTKGTSNWSGWSTSTINFSGEEDLGGGLKAGFFVNQTVGDDGTLGARDRWIGLSGGFGSFRFGRFSPTFEGGYGKFAVSGTTNTQGSSDSTDADFIRGRLNGANTGIDFGRQNGLIQYKTPKLSGITATVEMLVRGSNQDRNEDGDRLDGKSERTQQSIVVEFDGGPFQAGVGYGTRKQNREDIEVDADDIADGFVGFAGIPSGTFDAGDLDLEEFNGVLDNTRQDKATATWAGASYNLGVATIRYAYGDRKDKRRANLNAVEVTRQDVTVHNVGVSVPLGSAMLFASMYDGEDDGAVTPNDNFDLEGYQVGGTYSLSKRTMVYLVYGQNERKPSTAARTAGGRNSAEVTQTSLGIVHKF